MCIVTELAGGGSVDKDVGVTVAVVFYASISTHMYICTYAHMYTQRPTVIQYAGFFKITIQVHFF